jgi:Chaperone of endosialidase/Secretion system C-terminal sorting domain
VYTNGWCKRLTIVNILKTQIVKKIITSSLCLFMLLMGVNVQSQNVFTRGIINTTTLTIANPEVVRARNGLIAHLVGGSIGSFNAGDQWIGIGSPLARLYGSRTQWAGQALTLNLQDRDGNTATTGDKDAELQWGNQPGTQFNFNYITNPSSATGITRVMQLRENGQIFMSNDVNEFGSTFGKLFVRAGSTAGRSIAINASATGTSTDGGYGLYTSVGGTSPQGVYGVFAFAGAENSPINAGIVGRLNFDPSIESNGVNYAIFGDAGGATASNFWAGYFNGRTFCNAGVWTSSDAKLKTNVKAETDALSRIMQLRPATYNFKKADYPGMALPAEIQHGFIAQEMQTVFPEFVTDVKAPKGFDKAGKLEGMIDFKAINYTALIPVLTSAIQQQQTQLETQKQELAQYQQLTEKLLQKVNALEQALTTKTNAEKLTDNSKSAFLMQNTPNPASGSTAIRYFIPMDKAGNAAITITDAAGRQIMQYANLNKGTISTININAGSLKSGTYVYSLLLNGSVTASRSMVITE